MKEFLNGINLENDVEIKDLIDKRFNSTKW
jgi:hypothetical protein